MRDKPAPACIKQVTCPTSPDNPRNGEGDIALLKDGRLLLVYSRWTTPKGNDDSPAEIWGRYSKDGGISWEPGFHMIGNDAMNLMSVSLLRLKNGELMLVYGRRYSDEKMWFFARFSKDEAKTWSRDYLVTSVPAYQAINNARVIQLRNGRLLAPVFICRGKSWKTDFYFRNMVYYSDDNGRSWKAGEQRLTVEESPPGICEPAVVELKDSRVLMLHRTACGKIYRSFSKDHGVTWTKPEPTKLASPFSPATVTRIPSTGDLLLIWNNTAPSESNYGLPRSPLTCAISKDEGNSWQNFRNLEDDPNHQFCYTSITFVKDKAVLSYYQWGALKTAVVDTMWFYE